MIFLTRRAQAELERCGEGTLTAGGWLQRLPRGACSELPRWPEPGQHRRLNPAGVPLRIWAVVSLCLPPYPFPCAVGKILCCKALGPVLGGATRGGGRATAEQMPGAPACKARSCLRLALLPCPSLSPEKQEWLKVPLESL